MAYKQQRYQYETSPRKLKPEYEPIKTPYTKKKSSTRKNKQKEAKNNIKKNIKTILYIAIGFAILFAISYRNSLINESFSKNEDLKKELSNLQKENEQMEISIQSSLNLPNIEKSAQDLLGMKKLDESQKIYVSLPKKDYVEPASENVIVTEEKNWFEKIVDNIIEFIN